MLVTNLRSRTIFCSRNRGAHVALFPSAVLHSRSRLTLVAAGPSCFPPQYHLRSFSLSRVLATRSSRWREAKAESHELSRRAVKDEAGPPLFNQDAVQVKVNNGEVLLEYVLLFILSMPHYPYECQLTVPLS